MSEMFKRFWVRKADYDADEALRDLIKEDCDNIDDDWYPGAITCEDAYGSSWCLEDLEDYCEREGIAFDRWSESDLECPAQYRIFRPGEAPVDSTVVVDLDLKTYVLCENLTKILADEKTTNEEKITQMMAIIQKADFPCPRISDYRSARETTN